MGIASGEVLTMSDYFIVTDHDGTWKEMTIDDVSSLLSERAGLRARVAVLSDIASQIGRALERAGFSPDEMANPARCIEVIQGCLEAQAEKIEKLEAEIAKREAVPEEKSSADAPQTMWLDEAKGWAHGWNACRERMLAASKQSDYDPLASKDHGEARAEFDDQKCPHCQNINDTFTPCDAAEGEK
jgi:hypothetical protein